MRAGVVLACLLATVGMAAADRVIVRRTTVDGGAPAEQTEYWRRGRLVIEGGGQRTLIDFDRREVVGIDDDDRTYWTMPLDRVVRQLAALGAAMEALPEPARDMLGLTRRLALTPTGNASTIAGHAATEHAVSGDGVRGSVWLAPDLDPIALLGDEAAVWWRDGGPLRAVGPLADVARAAAEGKLRGMPVWVSLTASSERRATTVDSQVLSVREAPAPPHVARAPEDYRREPPPLVE